jgi:hypothetical protein
MRVAHTGMRTVDSGGETSAARPQVRVVAMPAIKSITPATGPVDGGTLMTITGERPLPPMYTHRGCLPPSPHHMSTGQDPPPPSLAALPYKNITK